jgi:glutaredoxin 3
MANVKIYTTTSCAYCMAAKRLLKEKNVTFEEIDLTGRFDELQDLKAKTGLRTVPQIFINDQLIGGYTDLQALDRQGKLDSLLT